MVRKLQKMANDKNNRDLLILFCLYSITFGLMVTNIGLFWDDWTVYNVESEALDQQFGANGYLTFLWLIEGLNFLFGDSVTSLRIITFLSYLFSAFFFYCILTKIKEIEGYSRLLIVSTFMVFPVNFARVSIVNSNHAMNYLFFFFGFFLLCKFVDNRKISYRIASLLLFFGSFFTPSFLVIYLAVVFYILYIEKVQLFNIKQLIITLLRYFDFILLPIIYWIIKKLFIKTSGHYASYNELSLENFLSLPAGIVSTLKLSYLEPFLLSVPNTLIWLVTSFFIWLILIVVFHKRNTVISTEKANLKADLSFLFLGIVLFILGVFAYVAVGKIPLLEDWDSRQQLIVPLGASFICYFSIKLIANALKLEKYIITLIYPLVLALFITANLSVYYDYQRDWVKQLSLMEHFKESKVIQQNSTFLFEDHTLDLNTMNRVYRFYEYTGLFKEALNEETRFGVNAKPTIEMNNYSKLLKYDFFNLSDYKIMNPQYSIEIHDGNYKLDFKGMTKLTYHKFFEKNQYDEDVKNVIRLEYTKLP